jgi:hypothetical protein
MPCPLLGERVVVVAGYITGTVIEVGGGRYI